MVVYCKIPYGTIARWCADQGYIEIPIADYKPSGNPLLIVDSRIQTGCHEKVCNYEREIQDCIKRAKGKKVFFGLVREAVSYIGDQSLAVWSKN